MDVELYEEGYGKGRRFSFGKNWQKFLKKLDDSMLDEAKKSLREYLGVEKLDGKKFVDIGSGSGLFSLAARELGAEVTSVDIDDHSIACAKELQKKFGDERWKIIKGSALDKEFLNSLGKFDIVYSWGVLHHTGDMWSAIKNVTGLVKERGKLYIAIYNNNTKHRLEGTSSFWKKAKRSYNKSPKLLKKMIYLVYSTYLILGITIKRGNPIKYIKNYKSNRGMNFWTDIEDWLGGHPYEFATTYEITQFVEQHGFKLEKSTEVRSIGCNEYLFTKTLKQQENEKKP